MIRPNPILVLALIVGIITTGCERTINVVDYRPGQQGGVAGITGKGWFAGDSSGHGSGTRINLAGEADAEQANPFSGIRIAIRPACSITLEIGGQHV